MQTGCIGKCINNKTKNESNHITGPVFNINRQGHQQYDIKLGKHKTIQIEVVNNQHLNGNDKNAKRKQPNPVTSFHSRMDFLTRRVPL